MQHFSHYILMYTKPGGDEILKTIVYADVLFLTNFAINFILLEITSILTKNQCHTYSKVIAASVGAIYSVVMFLPDFKIAGNLFSKFLLSLVMTGITFKKDSIKNFIRFLSTFYLVTLVCGGLTLSFTYFSNNPFTTNNGIIYFDSSFKTVLISSAATWLIIKLSYSIYAKHATRKYHKMVLYKNGKAANLNVLLDTGNMLKEPITGSPVIIVEKNALKGIIPHDMQDIDIESISPHIQDLRLIPFKSLGTDAGMLVGFVPDKIYSKEPVCDNITIAISNTTLSAGGEYNALAGPECFLK